MPAPTEQGSGVLTNNHTCVSIIAEPLKGGLGFLASRTHSEQPQSPTEEINGLGTLHLTSEWKQER